MSFGQHQLTIQDSEVRPEGYNHRVQQARESSGLQDSSGNLAS